jgi:hypothetical protein
MFSHVKVDNISSQNNCLVGKVGRNEREGQGALAIYAPSVDDYLRHIITAYPQAGREGASSKRKDGEDFYKFDTFEQAYEIYTQRPHEVVEFDPLDIELLAEPNDGNIVNWDVTGDFLDVATFLSGEPEHFGHQAMGNPRGIFATINVDMLQPWSVKKDVMLRQSVRVQALADWLEGQKIRTQIVAFGLNSNYYAEIVIKSFEDYLNVNNIAVATHVDFFRRIMFRHMEYSDTWSYGYGSGITTTKAEVNGLTITTVNNPRSKEIVDKHFDDIQEKIVKMIDEGVTAAYVE